LDVAGVPDVPDSASSSSCSILAAYLDQKTFRGRIQKLVATLRRPKSRVTNI
jgi:hypothetical protein